MKRITSIQRVRRGAGIFGLVIILSIAGYHYFAGYSWVEAIWLVTITIASVGYGEKSTLPPSMQLFTCLVIIVGISAATYTIGGLMEMVLEGELDRVMGHQRISQRIERMENHVILCGFGRIGQILAADLKRNSLPFVVIENDPKHCEEAKNREYLLIEGDATEEETLIAAGLSRAKTLVTGLTNDAANVFITLTGRNLNPSVQIIARAEHRTSERKLLQAGANRVVLPAATGAQQMARLITRPSTADLMAIVSQSGNLDVELDELLVQSTSHLVGMTVRETEAHKKYRLLVVAVKQESGEMIFNPEADFRFQVGDILILMGHTDDIHRFRKAQGV